MLGPGVLHDPVLGAVLFTVTDDEGGVVEVGSAGRRVEDSTGVLLEDSSVSFDEDGGWLLGDGGLHLGNVVGGDVGVGGDSNRGCLGCGVGAALVDGVVWVGGLFLSLVLLPVAEGLVLPATAAAVVAEAGGLGGAVDELLLREGEESAGLDEVGALESSGGGEGPAGAALALVLDWGDCTLRAPVDGGLVGLGEPDWFFLLSRGATSEHGASLSLGVV